MYSIEIIDAVIDEVAHAVGKCVNEAVKVARKYGMNEDNVVNLVCTMIADLKDTATFVDYEVKEGKQ